MSKARLKISFRYALMIAITVGVAISAGLILKKLQSSAPHMVYKSNEYDFGTLAPKSRIRHSFLFSNKGNQTLIINDIKVSCGCTLAQVDKSSILPNESASLKLEYTASKNRKKAEYYISVITNEPRNNIHKFCIKADVVPRIEIQPEIIRFDPVEYDKLPFRKNIFIHTENPEEISVRADSSSINTTLEKIDRYNYNLFVDINENAPIGSLSSQIFFELNGDNPLVLKSSVLGQVIGDIHAKPSSVFWGVLHNRQTAQKNVLISSNEKSEIIVDKYQICESLNDVISVNIKKELPSPQLEVNLRPQNIEDGSTRPKKYEGYITLWAHCIEKSTGMQSKNDKSRDLKSYKLNIPVMFFLTN